MPVTPVLAKHWNFVSSILLGSSFKVGVVCAILSVVFGMVATTGNPIAIALAAGSLIGFLLLIRQDIAVWIVIVGTILINGTLGLMFPSLAKAAWLFSMLGFFLLCGSTLKLLGGDRVWSQLPSFIVLLMLQMVLAVALSFLGEGSILEILAGSKRTFQLTGLMLAIAIMPLDKIGISRTKAWLIFLFLAAFCQLPAALFQRIVLVPMRVGMSDGVVAIDIVSGTFEASLEGGGSSSIMVIFLIIALAFVLSAWKQKVIGSKKALFATLFFGAPLFLGETKIALILLPMMIVLIFATELRRRPFAAISSLVVAGVLSALLAWVYLSLMSTGLNTPEQQIQKMIDYNFGSVGYYDRYGLNRTTATSFWFQEHGLHNPVETVFGHGIGSSYSGEGTLAPGHLNKQYPFMAINLTGISTLLWDTGVLGTVLFLLALFSVWRSSSRMSKAATSGSDIAILAALRVSLVSNVFAIFYSNSMFASLSHQTILAVTLGYLAWLVRKNSSGLTAPKEKYDKTYSVSHPRTISHIQA